MTVYGFFPVKRCTRLFTRLPPEKNCEDEAAHVYHLTDALGCSPDQIIFHIMNSLCLKFFY